MRCYSTEGGPGEYDGDGEVVDNMMGLVKTMLLAFSQSFYV